MTTVLQGKRRETLHYFVDCGRSSETKTCVVYLPTSRLGGLVVSVLATGPKGCGFEPGQGDGFF
jgi:hypothetical protein